jgi:SAM-dependent methyltransferase/uncharacterized protein YbaR (Trm112 family)
MNSELLTILQCPRDGSSLRVDNAGLRCQEGHRYPIVEGVPILLLPEQQQTIALARASWEAAQTREGAPLFVETLGLSTEEKRCIEADAQKNPYIDPVVSWLVGATSGCAYKPSMGRLRSYPIPKIKFSDGSGQLLLDVGCSWGRWTISAGRNGWRAIGIDPSLGALLAAQRVAKQLFVNISFVCGDARFLPFKTETFHAAHSYSVLQHFSEDNAEMALREIGRILRPDGTSKIQMAHIGGMRSRYRRRPEYKSPEEFQVRYWSLPQLESAFERAIGRSTIRAEAFGGLGLLPEEFRQVSYAGQALITLSEMLKRATQLAPSLIRLADSIVVESCRK